MIELDRGDIFRQWSEKYDRDYQRDICNLHRESTLRLVGQFISRLNDIKETALRDALIAEGWTPPDRSR